MKLLTKGLVTLLLCYSTMLVSHAKLIEVTLTSHEPLMNTDLNTYHHYLSYLNDALGKPQSIHSLAVIQLNQNNQIVSVEQLVNPLTIRGEVFNPKTGLIESVINQTLETGNIYININEKHAVNSILIFSPVNSGITLKWQLLAERKIALTDTITEEKNDESVFKLVDNGPSSNRVDLVFVAEGYTKNEIAHFKSDLTPVVAGFFEEHPLSLYKNYFNVWGVESVSSQSGAGNGSPINTRFKAYFNCYNIARLLCVDINEVQKYVSQRLSSHSRDIIVAVVNTKQYGGSGGAVATMSLHDSAVDLALHEVAHTFGLLADEYDYGSCRVAPATEANVTNKHSGTKWSHWFDVAKDINVFEGAKYCKYGMYRPTHNSLMRALGRPFYSVNSEQLIRRVYHYASPLASQTPQVKTINLSTQQQQSFNASLMQPKTKTVAAKWILNGATVSSAPQFNFVGSHYKPGNYQLMVEAKDSTDYVIVDSENKLKASFTWHINLATANNQCDTPSIPTQLSAKRINNQGFRLTWLTANHALQYIVQRHIEGRWQDEATTVSTQVEINSLPPESEQLVRIMGVNGCDEMGPASEPLEVSL